MSGIRNCYTLNMQSTHDAHGGHMQFNNNEVALVTGGSTGIGLATAQLLSKEGARIIFCGRNRANGEEAESQINNSEFFPCDITKEDEVDALFKHILKHYGRLDIAINNAGISKSGKYLTEYTLEDFEDIVNVNVKGVFLCLQKEISIMQSVNRGAIVNIASILGIKAHKSKNALYTMTKHAVVGLTKEAALEYADAGIRVNAVLPAYTETKIIKHHLQDNEKRKRIEGMHPMGRLLLPEEIAEAVLFLSCAKSSGMTGALVPVDGGCSAT